MLNFIKKIFSIFLIFNLTFVSSAQAAATCDNINGDGTGLDVSAKTASVQGIAFNNDGTKMFLSDKNDDTSKPTANFLKKNTIIKNTI